MSDYAMSIAHLQHVIEDLRTLYSNVKVKKRKGEIIVAAQALTTLLQKVKDNELDAEAIDIEAVAIEERFKPRAGEELPKFSPFFV